MGDQDKTRFNPNEWVPAIMAVGTWLWAIYQDAHGIHYIPDKWMLTIILSPWGAHVYSMARKRIKDMVLKRLPKKTP